MVQSAHEFLGADEQEANKQMSDVLQFEIKLAQVSFNPSIFAMSTVQMLEIYTCNCYPVTDFFFDISSISFPAFLLMSKTIIYTRVTCCDW